MGELSVGVFGGVGDTATADSGLVGIGSRNSIGAAYKSVLWVMLICWGSTL